MASIFCCSSISPYRPRLLDHEPKFSSFMGWAKSDSAEPGNGSSLVSNAAYIIQLVRQVNYGRKESIRYFVPDSSGSVFLEAAEQDLIEANFEKLNSYKNFRCQQHNKFFELNLYQKNALNKHHWRSNAARPSRDIDLEFRDAAVTAPGQDCPSSNLEQTTSSLKPNTPVAGHQSNEAHSRLKPILKFLLPLAEDNLGAHSLMGLLCLDWVNKELDLGLDHESLWETELTSPYISIFLSTCMSPSGSDPVSLQEIENLVIQAMGRMNSTERNQRPSRAKLESIVNRVLEANASASWVSQNESRIKNVLASGPSEEFLVNFHRPRDEEAPDNRLRNITVVDPPRSSTRLFLSDDDDDFERSYDYDFDRDSSPGNDYAACDQECGYCGKCDY